MDKPPNKEYWDSIAQRFQHLKELDRECKLVAGSSAHKYVLAPAVPESRIVEFESRYKLTLHPSYRSYLKYFSLGGAGPGYGISELTFSTWHEKLSRPLMLEPWEQYNGNKYWEDKTESLERYDGIIQIGTRGNPSIYFFIQTGELAGNVILVSEDIVEFYGLFHEWYSNWIEYSIAEIDNLPLLNKIQIGMSYDELLSLVNLEYKLAFNNVMIRFQGLPARIGLDEFKRVKYIKELKCGEWGV